jgi:hypothetical protein
LRWLREWGILAQPRRLAQAKESPLTTWSGANRIDVEIAAWENR